MSIRVTKIATDWHVICSTCNGSWLGGSWVRANEWWTAQVVARWHASLHATSQCTHCLHCPPIAALAVVDPKTGLVRLDGRIYVVTQTGVSELHQRTTA